MSSLVEPDDRHGPLPLLLIALTFVSGVVDATSFLALGRVFVANMTGNVVFLGFALGGVSEFSVAASLVAFVSFLLGAFAGGVIGNRWGAHRGRLLAVALTFEIALVSLALVLASTTPERYPTIALLALAMGVQSATARRLGVPDLSTVVLTQALTGLASESAGVADANPRRRLSATVAMLSGAAAGAALYLVAGVVAALALTWLVLAANLVVAWRLAASSAAWTAA
jgi:uncharacterized membrane protein YoaK (UPF0700 family)